ncbi:hypothetical protein [Streptomyces sp. NPDC059468]|uniref:hypothetical protein n=1 Tax=Streptomyces sp. NPDC059468 TaxID=3346845 RepID=UPI0036C8BDD0
MPSNNEEHVVPARELAVGDILHFNHGQWEERKIVINMTKTSAVTVCDIGTSGRIAFSRKVKGKPADVVVYKIGHRDLTRAEINGLKQFVSMGDYNRALFENGLYFDLPRFETLFGYAEGEGKSSLVVDGDVVKTITSTENPDGDKVEIVRHRRKDYGTPGAPEKDTFGARVTEAEHGIVVGYVRANLNRLEDAEALADLYLGKRYFDGWDVEQALSQAQYLADAIIGR